jgi:nitroimidazol reductase NimA-like FMN-containing flavoprotein (pyridoxamine 5'-phosphate oxidase superfamily)
VDHDRYSPSRQQVSKEDAPSFLSWLESYLTGRKTLTLATVRDNAPYCNLMTFAQVPGSCSIILVTPKQTTKYENMVANPAVSLMVSEVDNDRFDHQSGTAVTLNGLSREVEGPQRQDLEKVFAAKYPELEAFAVSPNSAVFLVQMQKVVAVVDFQQVSILDIEP